MTEDKLTIGIATYNRQEKVARLLHQISNFKFSKEVEVVIVNDGGNRNILDNIEVAFQGVLDVKFIHLEQNQGVWISKLTAILNASGRYYIHCDDDDMINEYELYRAFTAIRMTQAVAIQCNCSKLLYSDKSAKLIDRNHNGTRRRSKVNLSLNGLIMKLNDRVIYQAERLMSTYNTFGIDRRYWGDDVIIPGFILQDIDSSEIKTDPYINLYSMDYYSEEEHIALAKDVVKKTPDNIKQYEREVILDW